MPANQNDVPMGMKLKTIIDFLKASGKEEGVAVISRKTGFDPTTDPKLAAALENNPKILTLDGETYVYCPEVTVNNKEGLLRYIREGGEKGYVNSGMLKDTYYSNVLHDIEALKQEGLIYGLPAFEKSRGEMLYPVDQSLRMDLHFDIQKLWGECSVPVEDIGDELRKIGREPVGRSVVKKREQKKKEPKMRKISRPTNYHLPHMLSGACPDNIETV